MFLDAWLKLSIFWPIILLAILLGGGLLYAVALFRAILACRRLLREGELEQFWLTVVLVILLTVPVAALVF
ncbi:hypothetical protein CSQ95_22490 [Janthinobacterium sp. BJB304]|nr:hypothetical protein CSQ95_22490 [Janthinobacterium sp. BJB304]